MTGRGHSAGVREQSLWGASSAVGDMLALISHSQQHMSRGDEPTFSHFLGGVSYPAIAVKAQCQNVMAEVY